MAVLFCPIITFAQRLPTIQPASVKAPANAKADGIIGEWGPLQAYNRNIQVQYTIANDDKNLYLIVKSDRPEVITKIVLGGIVLAINKDGKKDEKSNMAVTFPAHDKQEEPFYINPKNIPALGKDTARNRVLIDSFRNELNHRIGQKFKFIKVEGFDDIEDDVLSRYNTEGIKAAVLMDSKIAYNYELSIPLKYLPKSAQANGKFTYNLKLNGAILNGAKVEVAGDQIVYAASNGQTYNAGRATPEKLAIAFPTDFWGEYVLMK